MHLKTIAVENTGPIPALQFDLPFQGECPLPLVLVGPNGSGKTTLLILDRQRARRLQTGGLRTS